VVSLKAVFKATTTSSFHPLATEQRQLPRAPEVVDKIKIEGHSPGEPLSASPRKGGGVLPSQYSNMLACQPPTVSTYSTKTSLKSLFVALIDSDTFNNLIKIAKKK
jgi:hypothetical protein